MTFFRQGTMPALDLATGRLLLEAPGRLFLSPNGHGGTLTALADSGLLDQLRQQGIRHVFYFQVDNPLVKVADPAFLGHHIATRAEVSSKVVPKESRRTSSATSCWSTAAARSSSTRDLPEELAQQTDEDGRLRLWAGSPAIHVFDVEFLAQVDAGRRRSRSTSPARRCRTSTTTGTAVQPAKENALKFELFIFDVLPLADRWTVVETSRREEFAPLKNASGRRLAGDVRQAHQRPGRRLAGARPASRCRAAGRRGGGAAGDQPAVRPGRGGAGGEGGPRHGDRRADVLRVKTVVAASREGSVKPRVGRRKPRRCNAARDDHGRRRRHAVLAAQPAASGRSSS